MRRGKLNDKELNIALDNLSISRSEVICGAGVGEDCAMISCLDNILLTTDPITGVCDNIEELALEVNLNDIYAAGGEPICALVTVLAPETSNTNDVIATIAKLGKLAKLKGIDIVGGHTEFTDAVNRMVISVTMVGRQLVQLSKELEVGDDIVVTKYLGIEATKIKVNVNNYTQYSITPNEFALIDEQDLSIAKESKIAINTIGTKTMHDITEGGVYGAIVELVSAKGLGARLDERVFPILAATKKLAVKCGYDIGYTISSGSLIIITNNSKELVAQLVSQGINASVIGKITKDKRIKIDSLGKEVEFEMKCDELFKSRREANE